MSNYLDIFDKYESEMAQEQKTNEEAAEKLLKKEEKKEKKVNRLLWNILHEKASRGEDTSDLEEILADVEGEMKPGLIARMSSAVGRAKRRVDGLLEDNKQLHQQLKEVRRERQALEEETRALLKDIRKRDEAKEEKKEKKKES